MLKGYRKLIVTILVMGIATATLLMGSIDQDTFKWLIGASGLGYLAANTTGKFTDDNTNQK